MPEIGTSGSMSGEGKRSDAARPKPPRLSSTLLRRRRNFVHSRAGIDPNWSFKFAGANVGYGIVKRSFNDSDKIDRSCRVARGNFTPGRSQNRA